MTDPDRGQRPPSEGASTGKRKGGASRRRGKAKRSAAPQAGATVQALEHAANQAAAATRRSDIDVADGPVRKRKRRRRNRSGHAKGSETAVVASPEQASPEKTATEATPAVDGRAGKKRRRNRNRRGPQVRPLAPAGTPPQAESARQPAPDAVSPQPHHHHPRPHHAHEHHHHAGRRHPPQAAERGRGQGGHEQWSDELYAALDLGTNNCRLLIAQPTRPGQFRVVDAFSRIVRLGEGLAANGRLSAEAMDRAVEALRICAGKLAGREIKRMRLIATEACRAAENGEEFLARVTVETGLNLEIINRETEARLAVSGCSSLVGREARSVVLFDIGGGSSEIAVIRIGENRSSRLANHITHWTSLPVGVVTLSERHGGRDVTPTVFEAMTREVQAMLDRFDCPQPFGSEAGEDGFHLIGTSGTVTTLAGVHLDLPRYDRRKVDGLWLSDAEVSAMQAKLLSWDYAGRAANPCIGPDRADLVLAGCAILEAIRRRWPASRMRVADRGLREGLLTDMMADDGVWRRGRPRRPHRER
ncbi:Ppx/GppA family phosphatase [Rhizobium cremeum]|uniref:Ppx/GppA phosphatase family protein n=1 Tax=Rhizobium cremeum TaxID=2813827 RepID=UPI000DDE5DD9|nr:Ppx/GppA family phosphatase [Rhizobium cremeum]MCJ8002242.1 Ppx/GppA family phosphatase [Rhizobium cremeum]